jgi:hypothetical protein
VDIYPRAQARRAGLAGQRARQAPVAIVELGGCGLTLRQSQAPPLEFYPVNFLGFVQLASITILLRQF